MAVFRGSPRFRKQSCPLVAPLVMLACNAALLFSWLQGSPDLPRVLEHSGRRLALLLGSDVGAGAGAGAGAQGGAGEEGWAGDLSARWKTVAAPAGGGAEVAGREGGNQTGCQPAPPPEEDTAPLFLFPVPPSVPPSELWRYSSRGLFWGRSDAQTERAQLYAMRLQLGDMEKLPAIVKNTIRRVTSTLQRKGRPQLSRMFQKSFGNTLEMATTLLSDGTAYVITGDIPLMWLRDSAAQVHHYLPLLKHDEYLRTVVVGLIRRQMLFIAMDPYGSSFRMFFDFEHIGNEELTDWDFQSGRTIHVAMHNYEPDSLCYFLRLCYRYWRESGHTDVFDDRWTRIAWLIIKTLRTEQDHNNSMYTYPELSHRGQGSPVCRTGMTWVGFRPSDEQCTYHYNIPVNMFIVVSLKQMAEIAHDVYGDLALTTAALSLAAEIDDAIHQFGVLRRKGRPPVYAYEVDGCGASQVMDDANVPSLLSIPYIGYTSRHDPNGTIARNTRALVLSAENPFFYSKRYSGIGSTHTPEGYIWHMSLIMQALTSDDKMEMNKILQQLEETTVDSGEVLHESFSAENPSAFSREWFGWAASLFAELVHDRLFDIPPSLGGKVDDGPECFCPSVRTQHSNPDDI